MKTGYVPTETLFKLKHSIPISKNIYRKVNVHSRAELARTFWQQFIRSIFPTFGGKNSL